MFDQISLDDLKREDGLDILIAFLDKHLKKDDLADSLDKFGEFEDFHRHDGMSISEYIASFDTRYRKIEKLKMTLPSEILAFKLLRKANIRKEEIMLVLTGMNYSNKETLYDEAKQSLKKFKGDIAEGSANSSTSIKLEPAFLAEHEEALLAAGYIKHNRGGRSGKGAYSRGNQRGRAQQSSKKVNPTGTDGKTLTCKYCGSFRHLVANCQHTKETMSKVHITDTSPKDEQEDEHVVLFTGYDKREIAQLGIDARNCAVLDSACSSTVCGETWLENYLNSMNPQDRRKMKQTVGQKMFKFGGGEIMRSKGEYSLPAVVAGKDVMIRTDVVGSDIPLLLSRSAMKTAGVKMDMENDTANIFGKDVALNLTTSGHYCIPIDRMEEIPVEEVFSVKLEEMDSKDRYKTLVKLQRQFAHPPLKKLKSLLQNAGLWRNEYVDLLEEINKSCDLCKRYAKTPPRPVVGLPMATHFNETVAMDLKQWNGRWILHIIDMWSRYTVSVLINRKKPSNVIDALMQRWVAVFGVMGSIMTDNGGEFSSDETREVMSLLNVRLLTTAAESPFQNGLCERVHAVTDMMLLKLTEENQSTDSQTLLGWANMARNALQMWNGFSSHQLVFGQNPNLPGIMTDGLPALIGATSSKVFGDHLNALHESRRAFIQSESSERIRRALRTKVRAAENIYENGDRVYYKREGKERWLGPATVVFQDGKVVFVRHGGIFIRVSPNRLNKIQKLKDGMTGSGNPELDSFDKYENMTQVTGNGEESEIESSSDGSKPDSSITEYLSSAVAGLNIENHTEERPVNRDTGKQASIKINDIIKYKMDNEWFIGTVTSRAGKATGKYRTWYNVRDENLEERSVDLGQIEWEKVPESEINITSITDSLGSVSKEIIIAKENELNKLALFDTYQEVTDCGQKPLSTRWVVTNKDGNTKARLVVRGFEEKDLEIPRDSPTVGKGAMRLFLSIAAIEEWIVKTTDIRSAFLQGKELDRDVYIRPPKESKAPKHVIWKLKHGLYGLKDGARQFYESVKEKLINLGFIQCKLDPAVFYVHKDKKLIGMICCHVDDFLHAGDSSFDMLMKRLRDRFSAGKVEEKAFKYIGFQVKQNRSMIVLDHSGYIDKMKNSILDPKRASSKNEPLNAQEQTLFRQIIGQLNWAVQGSRPDMAFEMIALSTKLQQGKIEDLIRAIKKVNRLKDIRSFISFPGLDKTKLTVVVFTDASLGNINEGTGSTGAHIVWLMDNSGRCCPVTWNAHKIKRVVRSTLAAETLSLQEGLETAFYYRQMVEEIMGLESKTIPIQAYIDNKSVIEAILSTRMVDDKRLRVDVAAIQELLKFHDINRIQWVPGHLQLANPMTKQGASGFSLLKVLQSGQMISEISN